MSLYCQSKSPYKQNSTKTNMNKKLIVLLLFVSSVISQTPSGSLFNRVKRTDIDLSTCIDNFDIHKDKIIRTQDSQKMGAKYLNAIDLGSRQECLRLCCETENCDVFVYEDKNSGGCYLFHCGPPEDFKCKFTHHVNYSSAVLAINRHIPDLESQMKLTKHEQDLTKLRKTENDPEPAPHIPEEKSLTSITTSTTMKSKESTSDQKGVPSEKRCSRYQFECRSTRECIAIYNACDGIPQCADGSDEATELGCPDLSTPTPPPPQRTVVNNSPPVPSFTKNVVPVKQQDPPPPIDMYHPPPPRAEIIPDDQLAPANNPDFLRPLPQEQRAPQRLPQYPEPAEYNSPQMAWNSHQTNPIPYQIPPMYPGKASHIFTHKENGLQVPEAEISSYTDNLNYPKVPNYYGDAYRQPMDAPNWVNAHQDDLRYPARYNQDPAYSNNNRPIPNQQVSEKFIPQEKPSTWSGEKENPEHIQVKMAHELKNSKDIHAQEPHKDVKIKIVERPLEVKKDEYPDVVAYKMDGNDGIARTPEGAVLSLTFGLMITCISALLIVCRLKIARRRTRRSGKGYAHDADYLVNGMYL